MSAESNVQKLIDVATALQAENASLKAQIRVANLMIEDEHRAFLAKCEQLAAAQKDAERIDFIEQTTMNSRTGSGFDYGKHVEDGQVLERGFRMMWFHTMCERMPSLRAAIDSAMKGEK